MIEVIIKSFYRLAYQLVLIWLAVFCLVGCTQQNDQQEKEQSGTGQEAVTEAEPDFTGRLYTSGLSPEEVEKLPLQWPVYQIVGSESYFFSGTDTLQPYLGRCMALTASTREGWEGSKESINGQTTYNRSALTVTAITPLSSAECMEQEVPEEEQADPGDLEVFSGKLRRMVRPAPDIAYDYALQLDEPYRDENHPVEPGKTVTELPLIVYRPDKLNKLEEALASNKPVTVEAAKVAGYAESTALRVAKILRPEVARGETDTPEL